MKNRYGIGGAFWVIALLCPLSLRAEPVRVYIAGTALVSLNNPGGTPVSLSFADSALVLLGEDTRFFRGIELEFTTPQSYLAYRGSLALAMYADLDKIPEAGIADLQVRQILFEPVPNKIQSVYQIPLRASHGLRTTPYVTVLREIIPPASFPVLFRIFPVIKGLNEEFETMRFIFNVKPILSDEGAVRLMPKYPENLQGRPFTVLIDDEVIENPGEERLLREGQHHLVILSNDYRNENRLFVVERGKTLDLTITLQDPTPLLIFEAPENAVIYFDNQPLGVITGPMPVEPGVHEVKFQLSDYAIVKSLVVQKGKNYRVSMSVDVQVSESE